MPDSEKAGENVQIVVPANRLQHVTLSKELYTIAYLQNQQCSLVASNLNLHADWVKKRGSGVVIYLSWKVPYANHMVARELHHA